MKGGKKQLRVAMIGQKTILSRKGGVEVVVKELSERMVKKGIIVTCYNRREKGEKRPKEYNGIKMKYAWTIRAKGLAALTSSFFATIMILFSKNDVVHYHAEGPCAWMWIIKFFSKKRVIATVHGLDWQRAKWGKMASKWIMCGEKMAAKYADEVIVLSAKTQEYFKEKYNRDVRYLPNGVSEPKIVSANYITKKWGLEKDDYILYLGRIVPEKGIHYLVDAYNQKPLEKKLVIAGGASDTDEYFSGIQKRASRNKKIIITGFVQGNILDELFSNAYLYVLPSDVEGMPLSLLEAMSYGNCCLVSDIDECREVVGDNGATFKKGNVNDLTHIMNRLCEDSKTVLDYKRSSAKYVMSRHCWNTIVEETIGIYRQCIGVAYEK